VLTAGAAASCGRLR